MAPRNDGSLKARTNGTTRRHSTDIHSRTQHHAMESPSSSVDRDQMSLQQRTLRVDTGALCDDVENVVGDVLCDGFDELEGILGAEETMPTATNANSGPLHISTVYTGEVDCSFTPRSAPSSPCRLLLGFCGISTVEHLQELVHSEPHACMHVSFAALDMVVQIAPEAKKHVDCLGQHLWVPHVQLLKR